MVSYLYGWSIISIVTSKNKPFQRFHANQGLILLIMWTVLLAISAVIHLFLFKLSFIAALIPAILADLLILVTLALSVIGFAGAAGGRSKPLPIIGKLKLLK